MAVYSVLGEWEQGGFFMFSSRGLHWSFTHEHGRVCDKESDSTKQPCMYLYVNKERTNKATLETSFSLANNPHVTAYQKSGSLRITRCVPRKALIISKNLTSPLTHQVISSMDTYPMKPEPTTLSPALRGAAFFATHWGAVAVFAPFINIYFAEVGLNGLQIGLLSALWPLATLIIAPLLSALADHFQWRVSILQIASLLMALSFLPLAFISNTSFYFFLVVMSVQAIARSAIVPLSETLITRMSLRHNLNYGSLRLWGSLVFATLSISGGILWQSWGYGLMFLGAAVVLLPSVWLAGQLEEGEFITRYERKSLVTLFNVPGMRPILLVTILAGIPLGFSFTFDGIYMDSLGGTEIFIGLVFGLAALSELPSMQVSQVVMRLLGMANTVLLSLSILLIAMIGYAFSSSPEMLLAFAVMRGLGFGFFLISTVRLVDSLAPDEWSSTAQSLRNASTFGISALIAAPLGGILWDIFGASMIYMAGAVVMGIALIVMVVTMRMGLFVREDTAVSAPPTVWHEKQHKARM